MKAYLLANAESGNNLTASGNNQAAFKEFSGMNVKDHRLLYLIMIMTVVFIIVLIILIIQDKKSRSHCKIKGSKRKQKWPDQFYTLFYRLLNSFWLTRGYIEKLGYHYRFISPCDNKFISKKTVSSCLLSWGICLFTFFGVFLISPSLNTLLTSGVAIVLIDAEVIGRMAKTYEITALQQIYRMIADVEHNFYVEYRAEDALYRSMDNLSPNMKAAAEQIYQLLISEDKDEALRIYYENVPNKYLRAFVSQCTGEMERGDQIVDGKRLFIRNMDNLKREIDIEVDKLQRLQLEFLGVMACVAAPVFCIDFVKRFAVSIKESMGTFFYGREGFMLDMAILTVIAGIYFIMRKSAEYRTFHKSEYRLLFYIDKIPMIKRAMNNYCNKNASRMERIKRELRNNGNSIRPRHFVLRSFLLAGLTVVLGISAACYLHSLGRGKLLVVQRADIEVLTSAAKESQYEKMGEIIEIYTKRYVLKVRGEKLPQAPESREELTALLKEEGTFYSPILRNAMADEILRRIRAYKREYFSIFDLVLCLSLSIITYYLPELIIKYNSSVSKDAMEDEVYQFNALISMLMYVDSMTVKQMLEEMESFAVVFKQSLRLCINNYNSGDMGALQDLKEREPYEPFKRLVDNLIRCDDMPICQAFQEIDVEQDGYMAKRKLANEKSIRKRVFRAYVLAAVPFLLLFAYGLVPTLLSSIQEINATLAELESTAW